MKELLTVNGLCKTYRKSDSIVEAVRDVSLSIGEGECLGLLGESGSGKSTLARILLLIESPDCGEIRLCDQSLLTLKSSALRKARKDFQVIFQDPTASLNQRLPIWQSIMEPLDNFPEVAPPFLADVRHCRKETAVKLLEIVGLKADHILRYPHELSGGQLQRVAIARGISLMPKLLICDEATASLDVSVQAQILQLLKQLQKELHMSYLFISHDIIAVRMMSDRILVMKEGRIVDRFASPDIMSQNRHPYTRQLVSIVT